MAALEFKCIIDTSLYALDGHKPPTVEEPLDLAPTATACKIQLVDCHAICSKQLRIHILEFDNFPLVPYAAISYPWRGVETRSTRRSFHVCLRDSDKHRYPDPISGVLLFHASAAALAHNCPYLWLDRLCIIQTSEEDKHWQIRYMYEVYRSCKLCIVLPVCSVSQTSTSQPHGSIGAGHYRRHSRRQRRSSFSAGGSDPAWHVYPWSGSSLSQLFPAPVR